jgi:hypothetical protein
VEELEVLELLARAREHDRPARDAGDRQRRAAAGVAVELGEHDAGETDAVLEGAGGGDGVLTDHGVEDEEDLVRLDGVPDVHGLLHHLGVHAQAARGVDDDDVVLPVPREPEAVPGDRHRVARAGGGGAGGRRPRVRREDGDAGALADDLELVDGVGALQVAGDEEGGVPLLLEPAAELACERRLAGTLQAGEEDDRRRRLGQRQPAGLAAEHLHELVVDDLDDLLRRVERLRDLGRQRPLPDGGGELAHHRQGDIGVEEGAADLADGRVDVRRREPTLAAEGLEGRREAVGQRREHGRILARSGTRGTSGRTRHKPNGRAARTLPAAGRVRDRATAHRGSS